MSQYIYSFEDGTNGIEYNIDIPGNGAPAVAIMADTAHPAHGSLSLRADSSASYQYVQDNLPTAVTDIAVRYYIYGDASQISDYDDLRFYSTTTDASSANRAGGIRRISGNKIRVFDSLNANIWSSASGLSINTYYRVEIRVQCGTSGNATMSGAYYVGDSTTPVETFSVATATTTATIISVHLGKQQTAANNPSTLHTWYDDFAIDDAPTGLIGPWVNPGNGAPIADAGLMQTNVEPFTTVTLNGSSSHDPDADTLTYAWTQTVGPAVTLLNATTATPSFVAPATLPGTTLTFQLIVNDGTVNSSPDTVDVVVAAHTIWHIENPAGPVLKPIRITLI
jgi:hypothetical protein